MCVCVCVCVCERVVCMWPLRSSELCYNLALSVCQTNRVFSELPAFLHGSMKNSIGGFYTQDLKPPDLQPLQQLLLNSVQLKKSYRMTMRNTRNHPSIFWHRSRTESWGPSLQSHLLHLIWGDSWNKTSPTGSGSAPRPLFWDNSHWEVQVTRQKKIKMLWNRPLTQFKWGLCCWQQISLF